MTNEFMSSEESGDDDTICVRPLQWRSSYANQMFKKIGASKKAPQARRQMKARWVGSPSLHPRPNPDSVPEWADPQPNPDSVPEWAVNQLYPRHCCIIVCFILLELSKQTKQ